MGGTRRVPFVLPETSIKELENIERGSQAGSPLGVVEDRITGLRIAREGFPYILTPALLSIILLAVGYWYVAIPVAMLAGFMGYFFRDPKRDPPTDPNVIVAPADGRVTRVSQLAPGSDNSSTLISIFLSPLDVHINRSPIAGKITDVSYTKGKFLMATDEKASLGNEIDALP